MKEIVNRIKEISERYLFQVESAGNESAHTDVLIEKILFEARLLQEKYDKDVEPIKENRWNSSPLDVVIYTDGACAGNPGAGGWGAIMKCSGKEIELCGGSRHTTNNRMELMAAISGLKLLTVKSNVTIVTDSKYVCDGINQGWAETWKKHKWKKADKSPAANPDLWDELLTLCGKHNVTFKWIKGHNGHTYNERCDRLAVEQTIKYKEMLPIQEDKYVYS